MSTLLTFIFLLAGAVIGIFIVWRTLREDYRDEQIFSFSFIVLLGAFLGYLAAKVTFPEFRFWTSVGAGFLFGLLRARGFSMRLFEVLEAATPAFFIYLLFVQVLVIVQKFTPNLFFLTEPLLVILSLAFFFFFRRNYRGFLWYRSGKPGFASLVSIAFFFAVRSLFAVFTPFFLLFNSGIIDIMLGLTVSLVSIIGFYIRSGRSLRHDLRLARIV